MLRFKMKREMERFKEVENAYNKIKTSTGVSEGVDIVNKFLTR